MHKSDMSRNNNKQVDLSRTVRLSGLSSGAKLELVQLSKSTGVVSVALQIPESEAQDVPNGRLSDKFPSSTTLWLILRKFEAGVAGASGTTRNLTQRGAASTDVGNTGSGRLYYQTPVIQVMGRELSSFTDLQKTLGQLGFNSGTTLLRLSFRTSDTPLEEAMEQIGQYFKDTEGPDEVSTSKSSTSEAPSPFPHEEPMPSEPTERPESSAIIESSSQSAATSTDPPSNATPLTTSGRSLQIFAPPTRTTPSAALTDHNPNDYVPSIEHAQTHQRHLSQSTKNTRLLTDAELATQAAEQAEKLAAVKDVEIKIRFPDESAVSTRFGQTETGANLYAFVRDCLEKRWQSEAFVLRNPGQKGQTIAVPDTTGKRLIQDLGLKGRVLVVFGWTADSSMTARGEKKVLKADLRAQAQALKVEEVKAVDGEDEGVRVNVKADHPEQPEKRKGMPKWLNKLSKK